MAGAYKKIKLSQAMMRPAATDYVVCGE